MQGARRRVRHDLFLRRDRQIDSSVMKRERQTPATQTEQRQMGARRLCGNHLYVMKLPFSHSPSVIKPSQAMRTARHHHGGRCNSYGNRFVSCSSGKSVSIKANRNEGTAAPIIHLSTQGKSTLSAWLPLFTSIIFWKINY